MLPLTRAAHALSLTAADFVAAALLYRLVSPSLGVLVGIVGTLLLCSILYQFSRRSVRRDLS